MQQRSSEAKLMVTKRKWEGGKIYKNLCEMRARVREASANLRAARWERGRSDFHRKRAINRNKDKLSKGKTVKNKVGRKVKVSPGGEADTAQMETNGEKGNGEETCRQMDRQIRGWIYKRRKMGASSINQADCGEKRGEEGGRRFKQAED